MDYTAWRISFQSSEQAARAAFDEMRNSKAAHAREVDRAVANDRVRDVHTCHDQCTKTELCRMTRRAEAAEADARRYRWLRDDALWADAPVGRVETVWCVEGKSARDCHPIDRIELDAAIDAAIASGGEDRKA